VEVVLGLDEGLLLAEANAISARLENELFAHVPALSVANIRFAPPIVGHSHAPEPFQVSGRLASGVLQIVDTDLGERFELRVSRHAEAMSAEVAIQREGDTVERLSLYPVDGNHHLLRTMVAPAEPHQFHATLLLAASGTREVLAFRMVEPHDHRS
ncbi:MAG: cation transporter, partial [Candidatus Saccharibacteria bacterium]|nr:cation transporter [Pseudorhodobacter sp.]